MIIVVALLWKSGLVAFFSLVCGLCTVCLGLFFLLMSLVGYDLGLWLFLDVLLCFLTHLRLMDSSTQLFGQVRFL